MCPPLRSASVRSVTSITNGISSRAIQASTRGSSTAARLSGVGGEGEHGERPRRGRGGPLDGREVVDEQLRLLVLDEVRRDRRLQLGVLGELLERVVARV